MWIEMRSQVSLREEAVTFPRAKRPDPSRAAPLERRDRFGGTEGNEILTNATAVVLTGLLVAEGVTIVNMGGLVSAHMFIGMVLILPVLLKLASTGIAFSATTPGRAPTGRWGRRCFPCG
jgi:hypothetical protein